MKSQGDKERVCPLNEITYTSHLVLHGNMPSITETLNIADVAHRLGPFVLPGNEEFNYELIKNGPLYHLTPV